MAHAAYRGTLEPRALPGAVETTGVMAALRSRLAPDAILTSGAGNFTVWAHRFYVFRRYRTQLAPLSGAMGYGLPAAIAAKLVHPERDVVCLAGDGDFLMTAQELATARQAGAAVVVLVVDNGMYGTIRMHQERRYPGRVSGTDLSNPDFVALARAFGAYGERVERTADVPAALDRALGAGTSGGAPPAGRPRGADAAADALGDPGRGGRAERAEGTRPSERTRRRVASPGTVGCPAHSRIEEELMAKSYASTVVDASAEDVWARIRDFNGLATWHGGMVATSEIEDGKAGDQVGAIRSFTLTDGTHLREQLLAHSDLERSYTYDFQKTPFDVDNYQLDHPRHPGHRRRDVLRRVVDDVRL